MVSREGNGERSTSMSAMRISEAIVRPRKLEIGDVVDGRYELRRDLGQGAGGIVFEARHRYTHRSVALKVVVPDAPRALLGELRARLLREARALALVRHPGIVEVLDGGILEDGTPFMVMEKLEGRTLEGLLASRGKLGREDTVAMGIQLCEALDCAHRAGVVHRDLKPGNIFIVKDHDGTERIKIMDFGIAQVPEARDEKLTGIGALIGTPAYMSPEQLLALDDVDHFSDIYALGATMFECLTGRVPYEGSYQQVLLQVCAPDGAPPKIGEICPEIGDALAKVIDVAIARQRKERFVDAMELARALHGSIPMARTRTFFLGPPPMPKYLPPPTRPVAPAATQRRKMPRAAYTTPVQILMGTTAIDGRSEDISGGGLLVISREPCTANTEVTVRFALPIEGLVVSCKAHVRWVRAARADDVEGPRAIGLEFIGATPEMSGSIARYVELMGDGEAA